MKNLIKFLKTKFGKLVLFTAGIITVIFAVIFVNFYIYKSKASSDLAIVSFSQNGNLTVAKNSTFEITINLRPGTNNKMTAAIIPVSYDITKVKLQKFENAGCLTLLETDVTLLDKNNTVTWTKISKKLDNFLQIDGTKEYCFGKLTFKATSTGNSKIDVLENVAKVTFSDHTGLQNVTANASVNLTIVEEGSITPPTGNPSNNPSNNPTGNPADTAKFTFLTKLQGIGTETGINNTPNATSISVLVKVVLKDGTLVKEQQTNLTYKTDSGKWQSDELAVPAGNNYRIIVKGPKHVAKRYCENNPTVSAVEGSYTCAGKSINLVDGQNSLDFSALPLLAGDLPPQDKVLNAFDAARLIGCLGKTEAECAGSDLNYDGTINATDNSILYASMKLKYDDEQ